MIAAFQPTDEQDAVFIDTMVANGGDAVAACVTARILSPMYPVDYIAKVMMERPEIETAVATLKRAKKSAATPEITRESIVADMQAAYEKAMAAGDVKGAIAAKRLQSELKKFLDSNITITHRHDVTQLSDEDLMKIASKRVVDGEFKDITPTIGNLPARVQ